ncbi:ATP-binding protein [Streptosporangium sp. NPDC051023]|uniref:ATP-binding protein n=1 Tax=Streptosporangium sp. NPDC051023 TaxID=3155410 RepID=UPI00344D8041
MRGGTEVEALVSLLMTPRWRGLHWLGTRLLDGVPSSVCTSRTWVTAQLSTSVPDVPVETLDIVKLLTSELVTNAIVHSRSRDGLLFVHLGVSPPGRGAVIHVEVLDVGSDNGPPVVRTDPDGDSGRGLFLVDTLSRRWGTADAKPGRAVWFQAPYTPSP